MTVAALTLAPVLGWAQTYFPSGVLANEGAVQKYSKFLAAMREPSLWELAQRDPRAEAYRFLWLRSADHPVAVRLAIKPSGAGWLYGKMTGGNAETGPGGIRRWNMSWAWKSRVASFKSAWDGAGFWNLPTLDAAADGNAVCRSHWVLEGIRNGQYHVVDRCSPLPSDPVRAVGLQALKLARFRIKAREVY